MAYPPPRVACPEESVALLSVSSREEDHASLRRILCDTNWEVVEVSVGRDANTKLLAHKMPVVIFAANVFDGEWNLLLAAARQLPDPPKLIVSLRAVNDRFWAEMPNLGCYDVLARPYMAEEVRRVVGLAWNRWNRECENRFAHPKPPASAPRVADTPYRTRTGKAG